METFHIYNLFETIGEISLQACGLYYTFDARVRMQGEGIFRCYYHRDGESLSLGVLVPEGDVFSCRGRIARKYLPENIPSGRFSILERDWKPILSGSVRAMECTPQSGKRKIAFKRFGMFPGQLMPYFCFFRPERIAMEDCMVLLLDEEGNPLMDS